MQDFVDGCMICYNLQEERNTVDCQDEKDDQPGHSNSHPRSSLALGPNQVLRGPRLLARRSPSSKDSEACREYHEE